MPEVQKWRRPESVKIPTVWARFESKKLMPNGRAPRFRVQDYEEVWKDHVVRNMTSFFLKDEPLCRDQDLHNDPVAVEEFKGLILDFLERKAGLVAIVENLEELGDDTLPVLAGCNITGIVTVGETAKKCKSEKLRKIMELLDVLDNQKNSFEHYQVNEFMYALGLSVDPAFRGHRLGCEILKARFALCKAVGVKATVTAFTAMASQKSAANAGYETLAEIFYEDYKDENGRVVFGVNETKSVKLMGARVP